MKKPTEILKGNRMQRNCAFLIFVFVLGLGLDLVFEWNISSALIPALILSSFILFFMIYRHFQIKHTNSLIPSDSLDASQLLILIKDNALVSRILRLQDNERSYGRESSFDDLYDRARAEVPVVLSIRYSHWFSEEAHGEFLTFDKEAVRALYLQRIEARNMSDIQRIAKDRVDNVFHDVLARRSGSAHGVRSVRFNPHVTIHEFDAEHTDSLEAGGASTVADTSPVLMHGA